MDKITNEKIEKYFDITKKALNKLKQIAPKKTHLNKMVEDVLDLANRYYNDAKHFYEKKDLVTAFAALNYSHGLIDCLARMGFIDVEYDNKLFIVD